MNDQAAALQKLARKPQVEEPAFRAPFVVVTGGKGGVGKTSLTANLALLLGAARKKVLVVDLDLGLANLDVFFRVFPETTLEHVAGGQRQIRDCILKIPCGVDFVPGPSGVASMAALDAAKRQRVFAELAEASHRYDLILADTAAGIAPDVLSFSHAASRIILVTTPEPAAMTDAYALLKLLVAYDREAPVSFVMNQAATHAEAEIAARKFQVIAARFLDHQPDYLGWIPRDVAVARANREQVAFVHEYRDSLAAGSLRHLSRKLLKILH